MGFWKRKRTSIFIYLILISLILKINNGFFLNWRFLQTALQSPFGTRQGQGQFGFGGSDTFESAVQQSKLTSTSNGNGIGIEASASNSVGVAVGMSDDTMDQTKCFGELGCIEITDEWFDLLHRPLNMLPYDRSKINTRFILYTRQRVTDPIQVFLNKTNLLESGFQPDKPVKFVIHGFLDSGFSSWVVKLSQQLTTHSDVNVFAVDWGGGSLSLYTQATANTRVVGLEVAHFIKFLMNELNVNPGNIHILGHSLGAHSAGYAGEKILGLGRISGLDPAEPYFQYMPIFVRLDPTDAKFVDVIHTDGRTILLGGFGMVQPSGHVDFYPNDGKEQPGCKITPMNLINAHGMDEVQREIFACNHHRAIYYFIESLLSKCHYVGHICNDYDSYLKGQCYTCGQDGTRCAFMGIDADKYPIRGRSLIPFFVSTTKAAPFCAYHYRVNVQMAFPQHAAPWVSGKLKVSIIGAMSTISNVNLSPTDNLKVQHGTNLTFMVQNPKELGAIQKVRIDWKYNNNYLDIMSQCWAFICNSKLFVKRVEVIDIDDFGQGKADHIISTSSVCPEEGLKYVGVGSGAAVSLERQC